MGSFLNNLCSNVLMFLISLHKDWVKDVVATSEFKLVVFLGAICRKTFLVNMDNADSGLNGFAKNQKDA